MRLTLVATLVIIGLSFVPGSIGNSAEAGPREGGTIILAYGGPYEGGIILANGGPYEGGIILAKGPYEGGVILAKSDSEAGRSVA